MNIFLISSAINAKHGIYTPRERFVQTIETCKSVNQYSPNSHIYILDGGVREISTIHLEQLYSVGVNKVISFVGDENVKQIQGSKNHDIVKNTIEASMYTSFFEKYEIYTENFKYDRVFKLSGRYRLNENFNSDVHTNAKNQIVIRGPFSSQFSSEITGGVTQQYMSRLWSFDISLLPDIKEFYANALNAMVERYSNSGYIDMEHCLHSLLNRDLIVEVDKIGVEGNIAPNGVGVSD